MTVLAGRTPAQPCLADDRRGLRFLLLRNASRPRYCTRMTQRTNLIVHQIDRQITIVLQATGRDDFPYVLGYCPARKDGEVIGVSTIKPFSDEATARAATEREIAARIATSRAPQYGRRIVG